MKGERTMRPVTSPAQIARIQILHQIFVATLSAIALFQAIKTTQDTQHELISCTESLD